MTVEIAPRCSFTLLITTRKIRADL